MVNEVKKLIQNLIDSNNENICDIELRVYVDEELNRICNSSFHFIKDGIRTNIIVQHERVRQSCIFINNFRNEILSTDAIELIDLIVALKKRASKANCAYIKKLNNSFQ